MSSGEFKAGMLGYGLGFLVAGIIFVMRTEPNSVVHALRDRLARYEAVCPSPGPIPATVDVETGEVTWDIEPERTEDGP